MNEARRVCLFGGSFNPPHVGHVFLSAWALSTQRFDELRWVPANAHAFGKELASFDERMEMCRRAIAVLDDRVTVSDVERRLGGQSRTIVTLEHLEAEEPGTTFTLLMGADLLQPPALGAGAGSSSASRRSSSGGAATRRAAACP